MYHSLAIDRLTAIIHTQYSRPKGNGTISFSDQITKSNPKNSVIEFLVVRGWILNCALHLEARRNQLLPLDYDRRDQRCPALLAWLRMLTGKGARQPDGERCSFGHSDRKWFW